MLFFLRWMGPFPFPLDRPLQSPVKKTASLKSRHDKNKLLSRSFFQETDFWHHFVTCQIARRKKAIHTGCHQRQARVRTPSSQNNAKFRLCDATSQETTRKFPDYFANLETDHNEVLSYPSTFFPAQKKFNWQIHRTHGFVFKANVQLILIKRNFWWNWTSKHLCGNL